MVNNTRKKTEHSKNSIYILHGTFVCSERRSECSFGVGSNLNQCSVGLARCQAFSIDFCTWWEDGFHCIFKTNAHIDKTDVLFTQSFDVDVLVIFKQHERAWFLPHAFPIPLTRIHSPSLSIPCYRWLACSNLARWILVKSISMCRKSTSSTILTLSFIEEHSRNWHTNYLYIHICTILLPINPCCPRDMLSRAAHCLATAAIEMCTEGMPSALLSHSVVSASFTFDALRKLHAAYNHSHRWISSHS